MTDVLNTDICIIGAGSGGLSVAAGAVQMGADVVLLERAEMGGDCLNTGCVPSKPFWQQQSREAARGNNGGGHGKRRPVNRFCLSQSSCC